MKSSFPWPAPPPGVKITPLHHPTPGEGTRRPPGEREKAGEGVWGRRGWSRVRVSPWGWGGSPPTPLSPVGLGFPSDRMVFPGLAAVACAEFGRSQPGGGGMGWRRGDARLVAADGGTPPHPDPSPRDPPVLTGSGGEGRAAHRRGRRKSSVVCWCYGTGDDGLGDESSPTRGSGVCLCVRVGVCVCH